MKTAQMVHRIGTIKNDRLYIAFEQSNSKWKLAMSNGSKNRHKTILARDLNQLEREIHIAKKKLKLGSGAPIYSCYEAGRDGFWLHRYLRGQEKGVKP